MQGTEMGTGRDNITKRSNNFDQTNDSNRNRNISIGGSLTRSIGVGEFITCGTMFRKDNSKNALKPEKKKKNISKDNTKDQHRSQGNIGADNKSDLER